MTITEFLEARIAEDEAVAKAAQQGRWYMAQNPDYGFDEGIWVETSDVHEIVCMRDAGWSILTNDVIVTGEQVVPLGPSKDWQDGPHIARHDPSRVLAECAAKRAIIRSYRSCIAAEDTTKDFGPRLVTSGMVKGLEVAIKLLASVYASHPDYEQGWAL